MKQPFRFCAISTGFVVLTFMLCSATIQTAQAQTCSTSTIDMKLLVVTNGRTESDFPAIKQILDYLGTPYDVLDMTANTGGITASMLSDGNCHGYYQGVIFAYGGYIYTLPGMSILTAYEQKFAIRQVNWYMYPNNDFGFNYPYNGVITSAGTASASFTSAGASTFWYANTVTPLTISNAYTYLGTPLSALPSGASVTPLLTDASGNALVLIYALGDGRQYLTQTFDSSPYLMHDLILAYGLINWVMKGIFLGEYHVFAAAQVDDFFINGSEWTPGTPCTNPVTHDRTAPDTPQVDSIDLEILTNQYVANGTGQNLDPDPSDSVSPIHLTDFNPANLVTPGVTGLNDTLVPSYLVQDGIRYVVSDTSVLGQANNGPNPSPNVGMVNSYAPSVYEVPRHPNDIFFNAVNWADDQAEFSCIYNNPVQPPFNTFAAPQILDYVSSSFVSNMLIGDIDPQMFHQNNLHDYDGQGHSLLSDAYDQTFSKYERVYNLPVLSPTLDQLGQNMQNRNAYNLSTATASLTGLAGSNLTISITVPATATVPSATIPVTGLYTVGAESYGGQQISHVPVSRGLTITLPVTPAPPIGIYSLTLNPTSVTGGGPQPSIGTVMLSGLAPAGGTQVTLSSSSALASIPPSVAVPAGSTTATFTINTSAVATSTVITISASYAGASKSASLTVTPPLLPMVSSLTLNPTSVVGGVQSSTGTVTLSGPAPTGGAQVTLSSSNGAASVPASVTVPGGSSSATFTVNTSIVLVSTSATISASYSSTTQTASLAVLL